LTYEKLIFNDDKIVSHIHKFLKWKIVSEQKRKNFVCMDVSRKMRASSHVEIPNWIWFLFIVKWWVWYDDDEWKEEEKKLGKFYLIIIFCFGWYGDEKKEERKEKEKEEEENVHKFNNELCSCVN
jgi:hypothetical protein